MTTPPTLPLPVGTRPRRVDLRTISLVTMAATITVIAACADNPIGPRATTGSNGLSGTSVPVTVLVQGVIRDAVYEAVPGTSVEITGSFDPMAPVLTDAEGRFAFATVQALGSVTVRASKSGYEPVVQSIRVSRSGSVGVFMQMASVEGADLPLGPYELTVPTTGCALPSELEAQRLAGTVIATGSKGTYAAVIVGAEAWLDTLTFGVLGNRAAGGAESYLWWQLPGNRYFELEVPEGAGGQANVIPGATVITLPYRMSYCQLSVPSRSNQSCTTSPGAEVIVRTSCSGQLTLRQP